ncbi:MAG: hypothetical protein WA766_04405, partial [Candidatus Acidiferrales bacterium]
WQLWRSQQSSPFARKKEGRPRGNLRSRDLALIDTALNCLCPKRPNFPALNRQLMHGCLYVSEKEGVNSC